MANTLFNPGESKLVTKSKTRLFFENSHSIFFINFLLIICFLIINSLLFWQVTLLWEEYVIDYFRTFDHGAYWIFSNILNKSIIWEIINNRNKFNFLSSYQICYFSYLIIACIDLFFLIIECRKNFKDWNEFELSYGFNQGLKLKKIYLTARKEFITTIFSAIKSVIIFLCFSLVILIAIFNDYSFENNFYFSFNLLFFIFCIFVSCICAWNYYQFIFKYKKHYKNIEIEKKFLTETLAKQGVKQYAFLIVFMSLISLGLPFDIFFFYLFAKHFPNLKKREKPKFIKKEIIY